MSGYPYHPIKIERDEETGALRYKVTVNLFEEYMRMIDRGIEEQGEAAMDAALEAHGYTKARIVRCRDCIKSKPSEYWEGLYDCGFVQVSMPPDGFCSVGERGEA